jgi:hypothetical protein
VHLIPKTVIVAAAAPSSSPSQSFISSHSTLGPTNQTYCSMYSILPAVIGITTTTTLLQFLLFLLNVMLIIVVVSIII